MELKEILNQNSHQASSNLNNFSRPQEYLNSIKEANRTFSNTNIQNNRKSGLQARYEDILGALIKTPITEHCSRICNIIEKEYTSNLDTSRKKRVIIMEK
jgi:hypothetical protein